MDSQASTAKCDLERMLFDESMEAKRLPLSLLKCITDDFSDKLEIGRGGFAVVYKGLLENGVVAVKRLSQTYDIGDVKFLGEVDCLMKAKHKNIVRFLGYCSDTQGQIEKYNGKSVMAEVRQRLLCFEYLPNGSLVEYIKDASLEWGKCYQIIKGVCEGLQYLHKERIVHADLKPANILLDNDMVPKITDFGISRCFDENQTHVVTSKVIGTAGYLAPEFFYGKLSYKSDIFSLGVIITEILTAKKDYPVVKDVLECWRHKVSKSQEEQIRVCTEVAQSCMTYDPAERPGPQRIIDILKETEVRSGALKLAQAIQQYHRAQMDPDSVSRTLKAVTHAICSIYTRDLAKPPPFEDLYRMEYALLKDVHEHSQEWTVKVRVTRISTHWDPQKPEKILRLNFLLLDEESGTMDAEIQEEWVPHFAPRISEGFIYYIRYFRVAQARNAYCAVDRPVMVRFTRYTKITEVTPCPLDFPKYACSLVPFQTLRDRDNDNTVCSDILGVFTGCTHVKVQGTKGGPKKLRNVYLSDGSETVSVALWGADAENFAADDYMQMGSERPLVFLFVGLTSRLFRTSISLQGSPICKWFVEPDIPEAHALRQTFIALNGSMGQPIWHGSVLPASENEQKDVAALAAVTNPHTIYNKRYILNVKIKCLKPNQQWWYHACAVCNKHAIPEGDTYRCSVRRCGSTRGGPRYRLPLIVVDPASSLQDNNALSIELVLFGPKAEELVGTPVHSLIDMQSGIGSFVPSQITDLYGREFQMRVSLSPSSLDRKDISFQVSSVLASPSISTGGQRHEAVPSDKQPGASSLNSDDETAPALPSSHVADTQTKVQAQVLSCEQQIDVSKGTSCLDKAQHTINMPGNEMCTPTPQQTPGSVEPKKYKRSRDEDVSDATDVEERLPVVSLSRDRSRAAKKLSSKYLRRKNRSSKDWT